MNKKASPVQQQLIASLDTAYARLSDSLDAQTIETAQAQVRAALEEIKIAINLIETYGYKESR